MMRKNNLAVFLACSFFVCIAGCLEDKMSRYLFDGTVTYNGEPVPAGVLIMTPNESKGNVGPQIYLEITDGKFNSKIRENGPVSGPHRITISGLHDFQKIPGPDGIELIGKDIFPVHEEEYLMPKKKTSHHFDITGPPVEIKP